MTTLTSEARCGAAGAHRSLPWWRDEILLTLAVLAVGAFAWYLPGDAHAPVKVDSFWLVQVALDVVFCLLSWRVAGVPGVHRATRRFWRALTLGGALFLLGDGIQSVATLRHPTPASTDTGQLQGLLVSAGVATCVIAMLSHPMKIAGKERMRFALDATTVMAAAGIVIWYFVLHDAGSQANVGSQLLSAGLMLVSSFALVKLLLGGNPPFTRAAGIAGGISTALNAVAAAVGPLVQHGHPNLGLALRLLPCIALAATPRIQERQVRADPDVLARRRRRPYSLLPYAAVGAAQVMLVLAAFHGSLDRRAWGVIVGVVLITSLVVLRQLDAFADNNRLLRRLDQSMLSLQRQERRFRSLVQHASDITLVIDVAGRVGYVSPAIEPVLGLAADRALGGQVHDLVHPEDHATLDRTLAELVATPGHSRACELRVRREDGTWRWLGVVATNQLDDPSVAGIVCNARDMTEVLEYQNRLQHEATHDPLTGLANRALFAERVRTASLAPASTASVVVIDLDDFKIVNDTLGHHAGDALLTTVAYRLRGCARANDTVARLGGDEFALLLPGANADNAVKVAERVLAAFAEPATSDGTPITIKASVGVATGPMAQAEAVLRAADEAMYAAKHGGKNAFASTVLQPTG